MQTDTVVISRDAVFVRCSMPLLRDLEALQTRLVGCSSLSKTITTFIHDLRVALVDDAPKAPTYLALAKSIHETTEIHIDADAPISVTGWGVWVGAWVYVPNEETEIVSAS